MQPTRATDTDTQYGAGTVVPRTCNTDPPPPTHTQRRPCINTRTQTHNTITQTHTHTHTHRPTSGALWALGLMQRTKWGVDASSLAMSSRRLSRNIPPSVVALFGLFFRMPRKRHVLFCPRGRRCSDTRRALLWRRLPPTSAKLVRGGRRSLLPGGLLFGSTSGASNMARNKTDGLRRISGTMAGTWAFRLRSIRPYVRAYPWWHIIRHTLMGRKTHTSHYVHTTWNTAPLPVLRVQMRTSVHACTALTSVE